MESDPVDLPRVNNETISNLIDKVSTADESKQASVLNSAIGNTIKATPTANLVNSPVKDCGYGWGCSNKQVNSQIIFQINKIYGVKK